MTIQTIEEITAAVPDQWDPESTGTTWNMVDVANAERAMKASNASMGVRS